MEEAQEDQQSHTIKGKRTKRQRPQSPNVSPAASSAADDLFDSTEEDQDMANCLILLAQCQPKRAHYDQRETGQIQMIHNSNIKFNSRRFLEAPDMGTGKGGGGYYVYECKTCNRTFPSFQALGGHRASHKKPKATMNDEFERSLQKQQKFIVSNLDEEDAHNLRNVSSLSLQLTTNNSNNNNNIRGGSNFYSMKSNKVHECSICSAEFTSGQALGGHMRRHRSAATVTNKTLSLTQMAVEEVEEPIKSRNNILSLDLDLNLPAPEDDTRELQLPFSSKQQQQKSSIVFSAAPTLVDCHY